MNNLNQLTKQEYMNSLKKQLRRLPKEDFDKAMDYFEEYFAEAGEEQEAKAIEDLGSPESAAEQIITNLALNHTKEPVKKISKGFHSIWTILLACFAAPIALPLLLALVLVLISFGLVIVFLCLTGFFLGGALILNGLFSTFASIFAFYDSLPVLISTLGMGFFSFGLGIYALIGMTLLTKQLIALCIKLFGHIIQKGKKNHETN